MLTINGRSFIDLGNKTKEVGKSLSSHLTMPIIKTIANLGKLTNSTIETGSEIQQASKKLGISAENFQVFDFIAQHSGTSMDAISESFTKINKTVADMSQGVSSGGTKAFQQMGLSITDVNGNLKSIDQLFLETQQALSGMADVGQRNSIIYDLFGEKLGSELQTVLSLSKNEMTNLTTEAQNLGIMSNETAAKSEELSEKLTNTHQKTDNLKVTLAEGLYPAFESIVQFITDSVIPVVQSIVDKFNSLSAEHQKLILSIAMVIAAIGPAMMVFGQLSTTFGTVMNAISILKAVVMGLTESFSFATLGIGALIGIVAMALLQNDEFKKLLAELTEVFITPLKPVIKFAMILMDAIMPVIKIIIQLLQPLITLLVQVAKVVLDILVPPFNIFLDIINLVIKGINLLIKALNWIPGVNIPEIPTFEKIDVSSSRKAAQEASSNVNNNTSNTYNNNFNIANGLDINKAAAALGTMQGKETS